MNQNLVGSTYGRFCIKFPQSRMKVEHSINAEKTNNAPNYVERFKVPMILMVMFNM
jgi:hypothetical protein